MKVLIGDHLINRLGIQFLRQIRSVRMSQRNLVTNSTLARAFESAPSVLESIVHYRPQVSIELKSIDRFQALEPANNIGTCFLNDIGNTHLSTQSNIQLSIGHFAKQWLIPKDQIIDRL
jgi:hypothetical protein